jgi:hypothetical protein
VNDLATRILVALAREAGSGCTRRLEAILGSIDPGDAALRDYLNQVLVEEKACLHEIECFERETLPFIPWAPGEKRTRDLVARFFPSFSKKMGEGPLNREGALYFVECLEEENAVFLRDLAKRAPDDRSRQFFVTLASRRESRKKECREILL